MIEVACYLNVNVMVWLMRLQDPGVAALEQLEKGMLLASSIHIAAVADGKFKLGDTVNPYTVKCDLKIAPDEKFYLSQTLEQGGKCTQMIIVCDGRKIKVSSGGKESVEPWPEGKLQLIKRALVRTGLTYSTLLGLYSKVGDADAQFAIPLSRATLMEGGERESLLHLEYKVRDTRADVHAILTLDKRSKLISRRHLKIAEKKMSEEIVEKEVIDLDAKLPGKLFEIK
jgi:hypothetical protein